jgi:[glutamine synthetase] adenylyltransferase / [glutamine synthetase]-adenylyl-L-tyrosine phosphorylase
MSNQALIVDDILGGLHSEKAAQPHLNQVGFSDWRAAYRSLQHLAGGPDRREAVEKFLPHLLVALTQAADPDRVLASLERFIERFDNPIPPLNSLAGNPRAVEILVTLFAGSQFLTEIVLRNPDYFERLVVYRRLSAPKSIEQYYAEAQEALAGLPGPAEALEALRRFQSWEMLRIGTCDLLDLYDLPAVTRQLSNLADSVLRSCLKIVAAQQGLSIDDLVVIAMGKLGGRELNYSSDIDLLFLTERDPADVQRTAEHLIDALTRATQEGFLYRVDMRLRPWGRVGSLVSTISGYLSYIKNEARLWEKQALLKARPVAGSPAAGRSFSQEIRTLILGQNLEKLRAEVFSMKQRTESQLRLNGRVWGEVKLGEGSIRDVEFTAQFLQLAYGAEQPEILSGNTLDGLVRLASAGLISFDEHRILAEGYVFLRTIEHFLQMMHYRQTHELPEDASSLYQLARRLGFLGDQAAAKFLERYEQHCTAIRAIYLRYLGSPTMNPLPDPNQPQDEDAQARLDVHRHLDRMAPSYSETYSPAEISRHAELAGRLKEDHMAELDAVELSGGSWRVTIVAYDFPGELSMIAGLFFVHGLNILGGDAFTYEPVGESMDRRKLRDSRRKIVDVFTVQPVEPGPLDAGKWVRYAADLENYLRMLRTNRRSEAQGDLTKRIATGLQNSELIHSEQFIPALYPIGIKLDNEVSERHTMLRIDSPDTFGFLYEFTNALAINRIYIDRVIVETVGSRVQDTLFVTDENGRKITDPAKQRELRVATVLIKHFTHLLPFSPNPESALVHFRDFIDQLFQRDNWPDELASLQRPKVLQALARVLGVSDFLWDDFLRMQYANLFPVVKDMDSLESARSRKQLQDSLAEVLSKVHSGPQAPSENALWMDALNDWKDREMFRIDMRHILGHTTEFWDFARELTDLAEVLTNATYHLCHEDLRLIYGAPLLEDGSPCPMGVVALGKFGGCELGFASDIELMFIYKGNGKTSGPRVITTAEFYEKLVETYVAATRARREGIFQVDLQLRPYGKAGSLSVSVDSFRRYFAPGGPAWAYERQALTRLRAVAGDEILGKQIEALRDEYVYTGETFDTTSMRAMRERQVRHLVTGGKFNLKYSLGGLVDVEYLIQGLQINHGASNPRLRLTNIREAMAAMAETGVFSQEDYTHLRKAHTFLRWCIDSLRVVRGNAKDVTAPEEGSEEFAFLARRMHYTSDPSQLRRELLRYTEDVREINARLLK